MVGKFGVGVEKNVRHGPCDVQPRQQIIVTIVITTVMDPDYCATCVEQPGDRGVEMVTGHVAKARNSGGPEQFGAEFRQHGLGPQIEIGESGLEIALMRSADGREIVGAVLPA